MDKKYLLCPACGIWEAPANVGKRGSPCPKCNYPQCGFTKDNSMRSKLELVKEQAVVVKKDKKK